MADSHSPTEDGGAEEAGDTGDNEQHGDDTSLMPLKQPFADRTNTFQTVSLVSAPTVPICGRAERVYSVFVQFVVIK